MLVIPVNEQLELILESCLAHCMSSLTTSPDGFSHGGLPRLFIRPSLQRSIPSVARTRAERCRISWQIAGRCVEGILFSIDDAGSFMEDKPDAAFTPMVMHNPIYERTDTVIGLFKLLRTLGEGGLSLGSLTAKQRLRLRHNRVVPRA
jgi:hypothetical protein